MTKVLVFGGGGFIGSSLVRRLKSRGDFVRTADLKVPDFQESEADEFLLGDLGDQKFMESTVLNGDHEWDEIYQLAADMGGAGYIFTGENDFNVMTNSAAININLLKVLADAELRPKVFYSSSACIYPESIQTDPSSVNLTESSAYPAEPDSEYGWEKLFSERLFLAASKNLGLSVRVARFHNIFGPNGTWRGGREKSPAAICRKVEAATDGGSIEIWGDGEQTRSFLFIEDCLDAVLAFMEVDYLGPVNIGSEEMVTINKLAEITSSIAGKSLKLRHIDGPLGVRGRSSDNTLFRSLTGWDPAYSLERGIRETYKWIQQQAALDSEM